MANETLLVVDPDARNLSVLEVQLRKAGYTVVTAVDGREALARIESSAPDLVISETALARLDGFNLARRLGERPEWATIPVIFIMSQRATEDRVRALELGVDDCLTKPVLAREVVARVKLLLDRRMLEHLAAGRITTATGGRFAGSTRDFGVADLLQAFELSRQAGVLHLRGAEHGDIYLRDGRPVDATFGRLRGEDAVYRALAMADGTFEVELRPVANGDVIGRSTEALVLQGMRRDSGAQIDESVPPSPQAPDENEVPTRVREEPVTQEAELHQWLEEPTAETDAEPSLERDSIAGVPRPMAAATKRVVAAVIAASVVLLVAGSLRALRDRQERLAEASRSTAASAEPAAARSVDVPPPPPVAPAMASARAEESASATASAAPSGTAPEPSPTGAASTAPIAAGVAPVTAVPAAPVAAVPRPVAAAPPAREAPIVTQGESGSGSLVAQASRALAEGAAARAVDLARQAVTANPADADAWLTLGAALQASGNGGAAHVAYTSCVAQARTPNVSECRVLAGQRSP